MPRACSACTHSQTAQIAKSIALGASNRELASRFGLTPSAVQRHRVGCLKQVRKAKDGSTSGEPSSSAGLVRFELIGGEITGPQDLLKRLHGLFRLGDLLEEAYHRRDVDAVVKLAREYRAAAETYAKVAGWLVEGGGNSTFVDARRQTIQLLAGLTDEEVRRLANGQPAALPAGETIDENGTPIRDQKSLSPSQSL